MTIYLVAYDLNQERDGWQNDRAALLAHIKTTWSWAKLSESSYAIESAQDPHTILGTLRGFIDANDAIFVITLSKKWDGFGPKDVIDWLTAKLGF